MNNRLNTKLWVVAMMLVSAQSAQAMEDAAGTFSQEVPKTGIVQNAVKKTQEFGSDAINAFIKLGTKVGTNVGAAFKEVGSTVTKHGKSLGSDLSRLSKKYYSQIANSTSNTGSSIVTFAQNNPVFTALAVAIPAAVALGYHLAPSSIKRSNVYKGIKTNVPTSVKAMAVTALPAAIWGWYCYKSN